MSLVRAVRWVGVLLLAGLGAACITGGAGMDRPTATVLRQAEPNPLRNATSFALAAVTFDGFTFDRAPEATWLAGRSSDQRASWENDKSATTERIYKRMLVEKREGVTVTRVAGPPPSGTFVLAINVDRFENSTFIATLRILDPSGLVLDEVRLPERYGGQIVVGVDSVALSLNTFVTWAAADALEYVHARIDGTAPPPAAPPAQKAFVVPPESAAPPPASDGAMPPPVTPNLNPTAVHGATCKTHLDCKAGLVCPKGQCVKPACIADKDCGTGQFCNLEGACIALDPK